MTIRLECPACQARLTIAENLRGKQVRCPKCKTLTAVPEEDGAPGPALKTAPATRPASVSSKEAVAKGPPPVSRTPRRSDEEDRSASKRRPYRDAEDSEDLPTRRKEKQSPMPWIIAGVGGGVALVVVVVVALLMRGSNTSKEQVADAQENEAPAKQARPAPVVTKPKQANPTAQTAKAESPKAQAPQMVDIPKGQAPREIEEESVKKVKKATAYLRVKLGNGKSVQGSGFFAAEKGLVFTNAHVLGMLNPSSPPPSQIEVVANSGEAGEFVRKAKLLGVDRQSDLGVLRVDGNVAGLPDPLAVDSTRGLTELKRVYIFGFPFGVSLGKNITISESSVSSLRREADGSVHEVQVNGGIHPGNSGGPVVDTRGVVVGVSVAGIKGTSINFAVPGERVQGLLTGRPATLLVGEAYTNGAGTKLPVEVLCMDPLNRLNDVKIEVWTGKHGPIRPPSPTKPAAQADDSPRQAHALVYQNNKASAEIDLPALSEGQAFWLQAIVTDKFGKTQWATAHPFKASDHIAVTHKPALLQLRLESQAERTVTVISANKGLSYDSKTPRSMNRKIEAESLETAQKDPRGTLYRLTLGQTKFVLEQNDKAVPLDDKVKSLFAGKFLQFVTKPTGDLVTRGQSTLTPSSQTAAIRSEFDLKMNQIANAYEMTCIPLPNREVKAKETWPASVPITLGDGLRKEVFDMHLTCTMEGCRTVQGQDQAVIAVTGGLKGRKQSLNELNGTVTGKVYFSTDNGYVAHAKLNVDCEIDFGDQTLASFIMNVDLTRVSGNKASIVPSKETPPPIVAKGKLLFQVPLSTLGPSDPKDYPGRLLIPYKFWKVPFTAGKTYIIEMNKTGTDSIDPYLILHNPQLVKVAEDDDSGGELNAKIVYKATMTGVHLVYATTLTINQGGNFQLIVSEGAVDPKTASKATTTIPAKKAPEKAPDKGP